MNSSQLMLLLLWIGLDLLVAAVRSSLLNVRPSRLKSMGKTNKSKIESAMELVTRRTRTRSTLKLVNGILRMLIGGSVVVNFLLPSQREQASVIIGVLLLTGFVVWLAEFIVERWIMRDPERWSIRFTPLARMLIMLFSPILYLPLKLSRAVEGRNLVTITEEELVQLVDASQRAGEIEKDESEMIHSVFEFGDTMAREIMVPRVDMLALEVNTPLEDAVDALLESGFSRVPVYEEQIDNVIGLLYTKDMLKFWRSGGENITLHELLRPARFVPETKKVDELLDEMQAARIHIALVVDEYGGVAGLVTLEDIVEEIFGEIQDEYDDSEEPLWERLSAEVYLFDGRITPEEIDELLGTHLPTEEAETLGGLVFARIGRVPAPGDTIKEAGLLFTVEEIKERRVHKVRGELLHPHSTNNTQEDHNHAA